jgi:hypothetical protein
MDACVNIFLGFSSDAHGGCEKIGSKMRDEKLRASPFILGVPLRVGDLEFC